MSTKNGSRTTQVRKAATLVLVVLGVLLVALALTADVVGLDITPGFGVIQMAILLAGVTCLTTAAFAHVHSLRPKNAPRSLQADIGVRLGATGLVFAYVTSLADLIGIGTHVGPRFIRPFAGPLQLGGLLLGIIMILAGLFLYYTSRGQRESSSMEFLVNGGKTAEDEEEEEAERESVAP